MSGEHESGPILAEQSLLGILLSNAEAIDIVLPVLRKEDFYPEAHRVIYDAIFTMAMDGRPVDVISVQDWLGREGRLETAGGPSYLMGLVASAPSAANAMSYAGIIREHGTRRAIQQSAGRIREAAAKDHDFGKGVTLQIDELYRILHDSESLKHPEKIGKLLPGIIENIGARSQGAVDAIGTGFPEIDSQLLGGFRRGDLVIIAGRPSMGKTTLAAQIAVNAAMAGKSVILYTLEMSKDQVCERAISQIGGIPFSHILTGRLTDRDYSCMADTLARLHDTKLLIDDTGGLTVQDIAARSRAQAKVDSLDMILIDYLQIMGYAGRSSSRNEQLGEVSRSLKALAKELNIVCVLLSQLNRECEKRLDKRPLMSDLRESGAVEQDADVIAMVYRDEVYDKKTEFKGIAEVIFRKVRNGEVGTVNLRFDGARVRFLSFLFGQEHGNESGQPGASAGN